MTINMPRHDMRTVLRKLGLTTNLKLCLDAGHETSLPAASTKWLDLSGNGYDFFLGTTIGADATDPTINGTAGKRSSGEYLSSDGGDLLTYDTTNETWMQNIHKDSAIFTIAAWWWVPSFASTNRLAGTRAGSNSNIGFAFSTSITTGTLALVVSNGSGTAALDLNSVATPNTGAWNFVAVSLNEATGANGAILQINGAQELFTSTYASPSASSATYTMQIGAAGNSAGPLANTSRLASFMAWEGVALDAAQLRALYQATRSKFGV